MSWKRAAAIVWSLIIVALCSLPGENLPNVDIISIDKLAHFGIFAIYSWLWMLSSSASFEQASKRVIIPGLAFAGLTEIYQGLIPFGRDPEVLDVIANAAGLLAGVWAFRVGRERWGRRDAGR